MNKTNSVTIRIIILLFPFLILGQSTHDTSYYDWFDKVLGKENTGIYNGKQYVNLDVNRIYGNRHAFFKTDKVLVGTVTYDGQTYYNLDIKYNLEKDLLLVALKPGTTASIIQLINDKVEGFVIGNHRFIRVLGAFEDGTLINEFYEVLAEQPDFTLLKKHKKSRRKKIQAGQLLSYEFVSDDSYVLWNNKSYKRITSKGDIIKIYPERKKEIKGFYESYKKMRKSDPDKFIYRLFKKVINTSPK